MTMYSPILRNRQSEMLALKHLYDSIRPYVMPVIDVAAPTKTADQAQALNYVARNIERTEKVVAGFPAVFVDSSELAPDFRLPGGIHPLARAATSVIDAGVRPIAVTGLHRDDEHHAEALSIAKAQDLPGLCVRLDATDVSTATLTHKRLRDLVDAASLEPTDVYVLLDLQCLFGHEKEAVSKQVLRFLKLLDGETWAGILVGGYGFPDQLSSACATKDQTYLRRVEQDVFSDAAGVEMSTSRWFADYTVLSPSVVELDWRLIRKVMAPKALYTLEDVWFVVRGGAFSSHPDEYEQYFSLADEIVALDEFCGADFSYGDQYISDRHNREGTPGSPGSWITACVNHHVSFTANAHQDPGDH
jgi:hypothetical protein